MDDEGDSLLEHPFQERAKSSRRAVPCVLCTLCLCLLCIGYQPASSTDFVALQSLAASDCVECHKSVQCRAGLSRDKTELFFWELQASDPSGAIINLASLAPPRPPPGAPPLPRPDFDVHFGVVIFAPDRRLRLRYAAGTPYDRSFTIALNRSSKVKLPGGTLPAEVYFVHADSEPTSGTAGGTFELETASRNFPDDTLIERDVHTGDVIFEIKLLYVDSISGPSTVFKCDLSSGCIIPIQFEDDGYCDCPDCNDEADWSCATCGLLESGDNTSNTSNETNTTTTSSTSSSSTTTSTSSTSSSSSTSSTSTSSSSSSSSTSSTSSSSTSTSSSTSSTSTSSTSTSSSSSTSTSSSTTSTFSSTTTVVGGEVVPEPPPEEAATIGTAVGVSLGGALGIALGVGLGLAPALAAAFLAEGKLTLVVQDPDSFKRDPRAERALKRAIAEIAGPEVSQAAVDLIIGCVATARNLGRFLQEMLDICFQVQVSGEEISEEVCQRLSAFDSSVASRIINRYLTEEGLDPGAVEVVRWTAAPNPVANNPGGVGPGDAFEPPSGVEFG